MLARNIFRDGRRDHSRATTTKIRTNRENRTCVIRNIIYNVYVYMRYFVSRSFGQIRHTNYIYVYVILNVIYPPLRLYWPFADDVARYRYDWYDISLFLKFSVSKMNFA